MPKRKELSILYVSTVELFRNGIINWILNYCISIRKQYPNFSISIVVPKIIDFSMLNQFKQMNIQVIEINNRKRNPFKYIKKLSDIIKKEKFDIVHIHGNSALMLIETIASHIGSCKTIFVHAHSTNTNYPFFNKLLKPIFLRTYTEAFACSNLAGKWLYENHNFKIVKNGIDFNLFKRDTAKGNELKSKLGLDDSIILGHVGVFDDNKNQTFLVHLLYELRKCDSSYKMILIGDGAKKKDIEIEISKLNLTKDVMLTGVVNNPSDYMQIFDMFLLPSHFEGFPFVLLEAQAMEIPCIVSINVSKESQLSTHYYPIKLDTNVWLEKIIEITNSESEKLNSPLQELYEYDIQLNTTKLIEYYYTSKEDK